MTVYYNENDEYAAQWLRNLVAARVLPEGDVDCRDIRDVQPSDIAGYVQCHFFAGIGGWPFAARSAGWPDGRPLWTGSCPCQPFSVAGRGRGKADHRHLWPDFHRLICAGRPPVVMGEQVASSAGEDWIAGVRADLEGNAFAVRAVDVTAFAVGAPHERQRIYWVAEPMVDAPSVGWREGRSEFEGWKWEPSSACTDVSRGLGHADSQRQLQSQGDVAQRRRRSRDPNASSFWNGAADLWCDWDEKWRRAEPGISMLVDGFPERVPAFAAFGNAVVVPLAQEVVAAYLDCRP